MKKRRRSGCGKRQPSKVQTRGWRAPRVRLFSRRNLLGPNPDPLLVEQFSNDKHITHDTPPCFLFDTGNDWVVPVENSLRFYAALKREGIPAELHIFEQGNHGVALAQKSPADGRSC
jgi:dipeptidyl aminopeptidase/acylaminoacyl peptidase